jgi:hypothetical protein
MVLLCYATGEPLPRSGYNHGETYAAMRSSVVDGEPGVRGITGLRGR